MSTAPALDDPVTSPAPEDDSSRIRRIRIALLVAALALFALLYAPQPVLPQLANGFALTAGTAALTVSAATFGLALAAVPLGTLSQALGRRRVMIVSLIVAEVLGLAMPLIGSFPLMLVLRIIQGAAVAGISSVAMAYLADEAAGPRFGATMGLYVAGTTIGGMAGRLVGGIVGDFGGWGGGMLAVAALGLVCTVLFVLLVPRERYHTPQPLSWRPLLSGIRGAAADPVLYGPFAVAALGMGGFIAVYNVLGFRLTSPPFDISPAVASFAFLAYAAGTVASAVAGRAADRFGRAPVVLAGLAINVVGLVFTASDHMSLIVAGLIVLTGGFFTAHSVASSWVTGRAAKEARGQASALYQFAYYVGSSIGGVVGGVAYVAWGWTGLTVMLGAWLVLAGIAVVLAARAQRAG